MGHICICPINFSPNIRQISVRFFFALIRRSWKAPVAKYIPSTHATPSNFAQYPGSPPAFPSQNANTSLMHILQTRRQRGLVLFGVGWGGSMEGRGRDSREALSGGFSCGFRLSFFPCVPSAPQCFCIVLAVPLIYGTPSALLQTNEPRKWSKIMKHFSWGGILLLTDYTGAANKVCKT